MKLTTVTLHKEMKIGQPNFSNLTVGMHLTFEVEDGDMDYEEGWNIINQNWPVPTVLRPCTNT